MPSTCLPRLRACLFDCCYDRIRASDLADDQLSIVASANHLTIIVVIEPSAFRVRSQARYPTQPASLSHKISTWPTRA